MQAKIRGMFLCVCVAMIAMLSSTASAQDTSANLLGVIREASGNVISKATVTATNTATNARTVQTSNDQGQYSFLTLAPGTYSLRVEAPGFASYEQNGIRLDLGQHATQDVVMQVGAVQQAITVNADVQTLDTVSSQVSDEVNGTSIRNLPLNSRNPYDLLELDPSFAGSTGNDYNSVSYSVNGGRQGYTDVLVDGTPAGFPTVNGNSGIGIFPSVDAIGEFRLLDQNYPAEFGRSLDGILNVVFKSGTNEFHGTAFEFLRNSDLDSNSYFNNLHNTPLPGLHRNQFGGILTGPIKKDRTFFLLSTELLRETDANQLTATVPTVAQRSGDFSQTFASNGQQIKIYNPYTTRLNDSGTGYTRDQFPDNKIPQGLLSKVALATMNYYPLPNTTGNAVTNANNYFASGSTVNDINSWDIRVDHVISDRQKVFARYSDRYYQDNPNPLFPQQDAVAEGLINSEDYDRGFTVGYTATPNARTILDTRLGFARTLYYYLNTSLGFDATQLGLPGSIDSAPGATNLFPVFSPSGYTGLGNNGNRKNSFMTYSLLSSLTLVRGSHTFKFGFDGRMIRVNDHESADSSGNFSFGTTYTQVDPNTANANSGSGLASMLLGLGTGDLIQNYKDDASQSFYLAEYAQDDWKITPKLTLNLGIRYDLDTPRTERYNRTNYFDPTISSPLASAVQGLQGGLVFVGVNGQSRHQYHIDANNFAPRVGFAYQARPTTVVHGGGAIVYGPSAQAAAGTVGPYGFRVQNQWYSTEDNNGITPSNSLLDNPFPQGFTTPPGASQGLLTGVGGQIEGAIQNTPTPYTIQWNLDVAQSLPNNFTFNITYVGNRGRKQQQSREGGIDYDQLPVADLALGKSLSDQVANPYNGLITTGAAVTGPTTTRAQLLKQYSQFTSVLPLFLSGGNDQYDGLQVRLTKRMSNGLQLQGSYVWGRNFDNSTNHQNSFDPMADYAVSSQDIRSRFIMSYVYELPFGRGRQYGGNISHWEDLAVGGWQVNGITTLQGGTPLQISANNTLSTYNFQTLYANTNGQNATLHGDIHNRLNKYFNTADFSQPAAFTLGNGPAYYDQLRSPGLDSTDLSLLKDFQAYSRLTVQFRAELFNAFNHVQFGSPNTSVTSTSFGQITSQANSPRQTQFGLKLIF
ncbi:carboxypeptidase regulatory-like domain-containing protein [Silvibacterium acidisoli]|uniref:carboxypeptidase regulatory-like domain-containing protein n=1 Tax=Acidobacteriaceae bacterium ZG23-2 TaxID=2883246 RepID=UPI00406C2DBE